MNRNSSSAQQHFATHCLCVSSSLCLTVSHTYSLRGLQAQQMPSTGAPRNKPRSHHDTTRRHHYKLAESSCGTCAPTFPRLWSVPISSSISSSTRSAALQGAIHSIVHPTQCKSKSQQE
eukprot:COSAG06_NODE_18017_length_908_cov_1.337454_1_plen_118_part_10